MVHHRSVAEVSLSSFELNEAPRSSANLLLLAPLFG